MNCLDSIPTTTTTTMAAPIGKSESEIKLEASTALKDSEDEIRKQKLQGAVFLGCVSGFFIMFGFGAALALSKRKDPAYFAKGMAPIDASTHETGSQLAMKALGRATLFSVGGFSLFSFTVAKFLGVSNLEEFNKRMKELIPRRKQPEPKGRTEFEGFRDLFTYLTDLDTKKKEFLARSKD